MMKPWLLMLSLVPTSYAIAYADFTLEGKISGFANKDHPRAKGGSSCYAAISAISSSSVDMAALYSGTYLLIEDGGLCKVAHAAYELSEPVRVISSPGVTYTRALKSLELKRDDRPHAFRNPRSEALEKEYDMKGPLSGYKAGTIGSCEIAIATDDSRYTDAYHYVKDSRICTVALMAYLSRSAVSATAMSRDAASKEINKLKVTRDGAPYWPPYHVDSTLSRYILYGPVGGYVQFKDDPSCFVSIKGDAPYNNGYHEVTDRSTCNALLGAYFSGSSISVGARSRAVFNQIMRADLINDPKAYWPPYGK